MIVSIINNHVQQALARLLQQYQGQPRMASIITALVQQIQNLENAIYPLDVGRQIYQGSAYGAQLDALGTLIGLSRNGLTDSEYLIFLLGTIAEDNSDTTQRTILNIVQTLFTATNVFIKTPDSFGQGIIIPNPPPPPPPPWTSTMSMNCVGNTYAYVGGDVLNINTNQDFSMNVWIKGTDVHSPFFIGKFDNDFTGAGYCMLWDSNGWAFTIRNSFTYGISFGKIPMSPDTWHMLTVAYNGSGLNTGTAAAITMWFDGSNVTGDAIVNLDNLGGRSTLSGSGIRFGVGGTDLFDFNMLTGYLKESVFFENYIFSDADVIQLYNLGGASNPALLTAYNNFCVSSWSLGDYLDTTSVIKDRKGSNDLTCVNVTYVADVPVGGQNIPNPRSVVFNDNSYVDLGNNYNFSKTTAFSLAGWFNPSSAYRDAGHTSIDFFSNIDIPANNGGYDIATLDATGKITCLFVSSAGVSTGGLIAIHTAEEVQYDQWNHFVMTNDGSGTAAGILIYLNGVLCTLNTAVNTLTTDITSANHLYIGGENGVPTGGGMYTNFAIWSGTAINSGEVTTLFNAGILQDLTTFSPEPNSWWKLGSPVDSIAVLHDSIGSVTGFGHGAGGGVTFAHECPNGFSTVFNNSFSDGGPTGSYFDIGNNYNFEKTDTFSWQLWIKTTYAAHPMDFISCTDYNVTTAGYYIGIPGAGALPGGPLIFAMAADLGGDGANENSIYTSESVYDGNWHHCVVTNDGSGLITGMKIYIDGSLATLNVNFATLTGSTVSANNLMFGADPLGSTPAISIYQGNVDEIAVWSGIALTDSQVAALYALYVNNPDYPPVDLTTFGAVPTSWWRMGDLNDSPSLIYDRIGSKNATGFGGATFDLDTPS